MDISRCLEGSVTKVMFVGKSSILCTRMKETFSVWVVKCWNVLRNTGTRSVETVLRQRISCDGQIGLWVRVKEENSKYLKILIPPPSLKSGIGQISG